MERKIRTALALTNRQEVKLLSPKLLAAIYRFSFSCCLVVASWFASVCKHLLSVLYFAVMPADYYQACCDWPVDVCREGLQGFCRPLLHVAPSKALLKNGKPYSVLSNEMETGLVSELLCGCAWARLVRVCLCRLCDAGRKCALTSSKASVQFRSCGEVDTLIGSFFALSLNFFPN